jgi:hypothetical protein
MVGRNVDRLSQHIKLVHNGTVKMLMRISIDILRLSQAFSQEILRKMKITLVATALVLGKGIWVVASDEPVHVVPTC